MKSVFSIVAVLMTLTVSAHAENGALRAKAIKAIEENKAVAAVLDRSAEEVQMKKAKCKNEVITNTTADDFNQNKTVSGTAEIVQICANDELDGVTNTTVRVTISSSRALIDTVQIHRSGF